MYTYDRLEPFFNASLAKFAHIWVPETDNKQKTYGILQVANWLLIFLQKKMDFYFLPSLHGAILSLVLALQLKIVIKKPRWSLPYVQCTYFILLEVDLLEVDLDGLYGLQDPRKAGLV